MSQITIDITPELEERVGLWQRETSGDTAVLITEALEEYLEGWEDCTDAAGLPRFSAETLAAMEEARRISRDPSVKSYASVEELKKALEEE